MHLDKALFWLAVSLQLYYTACLDCYSCVNVAYVANCTSVIQCPVGFSCHASVNAGTYTFGCKDANADNCPMENTTSTNVGGAGAIVGRSVPHTCTECCTSNMCNRQLCQTKDPACQDSGHINCAAVGSFVDLCDKIDRAKKECRRFCGLCSIDPCAIESDPRWSDRDKKGRKTYRIRRPNMCNHKSTREIKVCCRPQLQQSPCSCVDGGWSAWTTWSSCSTSCGNGTLTRIRPCSDPSPANGGSDCTGKSHEVHTCSNGPCPVHGGWSDWGAWGYCSVTCGIGLQRRDRTCSHPLPSNSGVHCFGDARDDRICYSSACHDGSWTEWGKWSTCSKTCDFGTQKRSRSCTNPPPSILGRTCIGDNTQTETCKLKSCPDHEIGFTVYNPWDTGTSGRIRFLSVITNMGGGYNTSTGIFTCSVAGVYSFSLHIVKTSSATQAYCYIYKNSLRLNGANAHLTYPSTSGLMAASTTVYVHLVPGDKVYLRYCSAASTMYTGLSDTSFTGHIVHSD